jgi:hypothetical protein
MLFACGISNYSTGLFHLMNHAFFVRWHRYINLFDGLALGIYLRGICRRAYFLSLSFRSGIKMGNESESLVKVT